MINISAKRNGEYNVIKVNGDSLDAYSTPYIKRELVSFFASGEDKKIGGSINCLDVSDIEHLDIPGSVVFSVFESLNDNSGYGKPCIKGLHGSPKILLDMNYRNKSKFDFI